jgi:hypothetical protein
LALAPRCQINRSAAARRHAERKAPMKKFFIAIAVAGAMAGFNATFNSKESQIKAGLELAAKTLNQKCPMKADENTRLDHVSTTDRSITYQYTILGIEDDVVLASKQNIQDAVTKLANDKEETKKLLDLGVTMSYRYKNEAGKDLIAFDIANPH